MAEGWNERRYSDETAHAIDRAVQEIAEESFKRAVSILEKHRALLERGAKLLLEKETLDENELQVLRADLQKASHFESAA